MRFATVGLVALVLATPADASAQIDRKMKKVDGARWFAGAYEASCERTGEQGLQILTIYGFGKNDKEALQEARRNAVRAMLFRGVRTNACSVPPLLTPADLTEQGDKFLDEFFKEGGQYLSYVAYAGDAVDSRTKVGKQVKIGSVVVVDLNRLRKDLEAAGMVAAMGDPFSRP